jgi:hypothetical protein
MPVSLEHGALERAGRAGCHGSRATVGAKDLFCWRIERVRGYEQRGPNGRG